MIQPPRPSGQVRSTVVPAPISEAEVLAIVRRVLAGELSLTALLDALPGTAEQGAIIHRTASGWELLAPGTDGYVLTTHGPGADVTWEPPGGGSGGLEADFAKQMVSLRV